MTTSTAASVGAAVEPWHPGQPHAELAADVRWWLGSPLSLGLFGRLALDQVAYRPVAAAVDRSGRFQENFTDRGIRSLTYGMLMLFGDEADRRFDTVEELRLALLAFRQTDSQSWIVERHSYRTPVQARSGRT